MLRQAVERNTLWLMHATDLPQAEAMLGDATGRTSPYHCFQKWLFILGPQSGKDDVAVTVGFGVQFMAHHLHQSLLYFIRFLCLLEISGWLS